MRQCVPRGEAPESITSGRSLSGSTFRLAGTADSGSPGLALTGAALPFVMIAASASDSFTTRYSMRDEL